MGWGWCNLSFFNYFFVLFVHSRCEMLFVCATFSETNYFCGFFISFLICFALRVWEREKTCYDHCRLISYAHTKQPTVKQSEMLLTSSADITLLLTTIVCFPRPNRRVKIRITCRNRKRKDNFTRTKNSWRDWRGYGKTSGAKRKNWLR